MGVRPYLLGCSILLIVLSIILIFASTATNTWITQAFAFTDGTGATGTYVIGPLRFCVNLNPNPYYQSACGIIDATCFADAGTVAAAFFPACTHFNMIRIFLALSLGFTTLSLICHIILILLPSPRTTMTCIVFTCISWICGMLVMALFVSYKMKLMGTWNYGRSFGMMVVVWPFLLLTMICGILLYTRYPPSPMAAYIDNDAKERQRQAQMLEKEQKEADKRERDRVKNEKKTKDKDSTEMVPPLAPPIDASPTHSHPDTPTYSHAPGEEPSTSHIPTPRNLSPGDTPIQQKQTKFSIPALPSVVITHPAPMTHFSSNPNLSSNNADPSSAYQPHIITSSPMTNSSPLNTDRSDKDNPKKDKKKKKDVLEDDPSDAADWWLAHNNQIVARTTVFRAGSMISTGNSPLMDPTRSPASSEYEYRGSMINPVPGTMVTPMTNPSIPSAIVPFRLPPRVGEQSSQQQYDPGQYEQQQLYQDNQTTSSGYGTPRGVTWAATSNPTYSAYNQYPPPPQ